MTTEEIRERVAKAFEEVGIIGAVGDDPLGVLIAFFQSAAEENKQLRKQLEIAKSHLTITGLHAYNIQTKQNDDF